MTRAEIKRLAKAKWGKHALVDENKRVPDPETREIIRREYMKLKDQEPQAPPPTPAQLEYQRKHREWKEQMSLLRGRCMGTKRYRVGKILSDTPIGSCFHIAGDGDTWEEAARNAKLVKTDS